MRKLFCAVVLAVLSGIGFAHELSGVWYDAPAFPEGWESWELGKFRREVSWGTVDFVDGSCFIIDAETDSPIIFGYAAILEKESEGVYFVTLRDGTFEMHYRFHLLTRNSMRIENIDDDFYILTSDNSTVYKISSPPPNVELPVAAQETAVIEEAAKPEESAEPETEREISTPAAPQKASLPWFIIGGGVLVLAVCVAFFAVRKRKGRG